ncbi:MAG TPA: triose-phosphate isomerase [Acholeplasmataceae bacterium]|jgi:triosephosphate isomerase|nr:triose-phosphate isomerase [Acholeplasmataceae bacterium]HQC30698.1 triose-phosphate isomerase [Acholeplasmataceae bacterium]
MKKRVPVIAGNWKMFKTRDDALSFIYQVNTKVPAKEKVETILFVSPIYLRTLVKRQEDDLRLGAQNMHFAEEGAYTGEVSANQLTNIGTTHILIGHSERRQYFAETDETVNLKIKTAHKHGLIPTVCVGESLEIREAGKTNEVVKVQIVKAFDGISKEDALKTIVAYEPIWAIGTGRTATPQDANDTIKSIRADLAELYGQKVADQIRILYGGSVNPKNIKDLLAESDIDGALVGGASLDPQSYLQLVEAANNK